MMASKRRIGRVYGRGAKDRADPGRCRKRRTWQLGDERHDSERERQRVRDAAQHVAAARYVAGANT
jgi:hypothetical protein